MMERSVWEKEGGFAQRNQTENESKVTITAQTFSFTLMNHHVIQNLTAWQPSISMPTQPRPSTCHPLKWTPLLLTAVLLFSHYKFLPPSHSPTPIQNINMAPKYGFRYGCLLFLSCLLASLVEPAMGSTRKLSALVEEQPFPMKYHNGALLKGKVTVNLVWYGSFSAIQRSIIIDFLESFNSLTPPSPSVASWWKTTEKYHGGSSAVVVGKQVLDQRYSLGKVLKTSHLTALASKPNFIGSVTVLLTAKDVAVDGFCMSRCGTHGWTHSGKVRSAYVWVGNSETQCPGQCAWPFHQPMYGPQTPPLVAPNGDVGVDGMVINLATLLANTVTNPFNGGYFQGPPTAPLEAVSACTGVFGSGAYPGYPGRLLVEKSSGASYNAQGVNGRRYLVPAMWDPETSACATLV